MSGLYFSPLKGRDTSAYAKYFRSEHANELARPRDNPATIVGWGCGQLVTSPQAVKNILTAFAHSSHLRTLYEPFPNDDNRNWLTVAYEAGGKVHMGQIDFDGDFTEFFGPSVTKTLKKYFVGVFDDSDIDGK